MKLFYIALFGACGCVARYWVSLRVYALAGVGLPYGTLSVNILGSFLLGLLMEIEWRSGFLSADLRTGLAVGFLGGFTTFSTFSYETLRLLEKGNLVQAGANIVLNVVVCVVFAGLGIYCARQF
ncbi:camphor resistance protein CrcB [Geoalkalibacter ferrihydriticus]|uniref:Fluoride-specific ion channel FluC n=2 Tax=Geoalkalibacter ferrihydriticus TaxID=392333 RepID=A0A0C2HHJ1_9BACT|nr:fluoride efflux transporter CrcB [Geoalkalibacter ferrihydriticus]KIH76461.1 camphor resistance protein CrcB [Geoalkalibacter ferrihydriticus DSM 17813]SDL96399.1 camphor resistance protein CrcB [Geoalkalibacter ferrihydriticus]